MEERCPSPMPRTLITNRRLPAAVPRLVRMGDHARVAQRRALDGVFAGERRTQQQHSWLGKFPAGIQPVGKLDGRADGRCRRGRGDARRSGSRYRPATIALRSSSRARIRASTAPARESWCSKPSWPGTNSRVMTRDGSAAMPLRAARDQPRPHGSHCRTVEKRRACCSVESTASVDSAPWLRLPRRRAGRRIHRRSGGPT